MGSSAEIIKDYVSEFARIQTWMLEIREAAPNTYASMYLRYKELKVVLTSLGVNLTELDVINNE